MDFFKELENSLQPGIQEIITHPFLKRMGEGSLTKKQLQYFTEQYSIYCNYFPRFLAAAAANIVDDVTRMPIIENLWEEHGEGKLAKSHRVLFNQFAFALDLTIFDLDEADALPSTQICVDELMNICLNKHFLESLGALGPGTEFFTSDEYLVIRDGLKKYDFLSADDIYFWTAHISLDETHYSEMIDILRPWASNDLNKQLITRGANKAIDLEIDFWNGLEKHLPKNA